MLPPDNKVLFNKYKYFKKLFVENVIVTYCKKEKHHTYYFPIRNHNAYRSGVSLYVNVVSEAPQRRISGTQFFADFFMEPNC